MYKVSLAEQQDFKSEFSQIDLENHPSNWFSARQNRIKPISVL